MGYYIYRNRVHNKAVIHEDTCSFCNFGKGIDKNSENSIVGGWIGPYEDISLAEKEAISSGRKNLKRCSFCVSKKPQIV